MNSDLFALSGRSAFVTGGASGIGRSLAIALAESGADVAIIDIAEKAGRTVVEEVKALGARSVFVRCDISDSDQVFEMVQKVVTELGRIDIVINAAGTFRLALDEDTSPDDWNTVIAINLTGTWLCCCEAMRQMKAQSPPGGKIINIGSIAAVTACGNGAYDASKAAVMHLTKTLAAQWGQHGINVNCVSPGFVSPVFGKERTAEEFARLDTMTPIGTVLRPDDVCGAVIFMASAASDFITGQHLIVDGGHTVSTWAYSFLER